MLSSALGIVSVRPDHRGRHDISNAPSRAKVPVSRSRYCRLECVADRRRRAGTDKPRAAAPPASECGPRMAGTTPRRRFGAGPRFGKRGSLPVPSPRTHSPRRGRRRAAIGGPARERHREAAPLLAAVERAHRIEQQRVARLRAEPKLGRTAAEAGRDLADTGLVEQGEPGEDERVVERREAGGVERCAAARRIVALIVRAGNERRPKAEIGVDPVGGAAEGELVVRAGFEGRVQCGGGDRRRAIASSSSSAKARSDRPTSPTTTSSTRPDRYWSICSSRK